MPPKISIVMPVCNVADYVVESVASVQAQSFESWELIVVNDGSADETGMIVQALAKEDERIHLISQPNAGVANARNRGLDLAQGDFLCFLDGDDLWHKDFLERAVAKLEEAQADFFFCGVEYLEADGVLRPCVMKLSGEVPSFGTLVEKLLSGDITFCMGSVALRRSPGMRGLRFTEGCRYGEDTEYLLRMLPLSRSVCFLTDPLFRYRRRPGSTTQKPWDWRVRQDGIHAVDRALEHLRDHSRTSREPLLQDQRSRQHFWKYRLLYRMVKNRDWNDVQHLLEDNRWRDALHAVARQESRWHRRKARIILGGNRLIWRFISLYAELKASPLLASRKGK